VAVLLTLTELLRGRDIPIGLEWVVFNGEELGGVGDLEYLRRCRGTLDGIIAAINIDGVGQELGLRASRPSPPSAAFTAHVSALVREGHPGVVEVAPWPRATTTPSTRTASRASRSRRLARQTSCTVPPTLSSG
jgi:Zn-dependent M28 family amino/carboxypeptidase